MAYYFQRKSKSSFLKIKLAEETSKKIFSENFLNTQVNDYQNVFFFSAAGACMPALLIRAKSIKDYFLGCFPKF